MPLLRNYYIEGLKLEDRQSNFSYIVGNNLAPAMEIEKNIKSDDFMAAFCGDSNESWRLTPSPPVCKEQKLLGNETKLCQCCAACKLMSLGNRDKYKERFLFSYWPF